MRLVPLLLLLIAVLFGSGFWYDYIDTTCKTPVLYHIGDIDSRFGTSAEEIRRIALRAESMWEGVLSEDLFIYSEIGEGLPLNLIYDERQENTEREAEVRADLETKEGMSESVAVQYEKLITEFRALKKKYESRVIAYEASLDSYNEEVTSWNNKGGAPESVVKDLKESEQSLKDEQTELELLAKKLNALTTDLNRIGARGNELITDYNGIVQKYNTEFSEGYEFTQGDYKRDSINIYQFDSEDELVIVLAHEFGHALSLDHVQNEQSVMYHLMGGQSIAEGVSTEDVSEFTRMCKNKTVFQRVANFIAEAFAL